MIVEYDAVINLSIYLSIDAAINISINQSIYQSIYLSIYAVICLTEWIEPVSCLAREVQQHHHPLACELRDR
jgi:hypothetical protein